MGTNTLNRLSIFVGIAGLIAFVFAGILYIESRKGMTLIPSAEAGDHQKAPDTHGHSTEKDAHGCPVEKGETCSDSHGQSNSDLDRPVDELWAAKCEHDILQFECDECRYEVGVVKLPPEIMAAMGPAGFVKTGQAHETPVLAERPLSGELGINEDKTVAITSPLAGLVKAIHVPTGARVKAGEALFTIDSRDVSEGKAAYVKAMAALDLARKTADREISLYEKKISARMDVDEAKARLTEVSAEAAGAGANLLRLGVPPEVIAGLEGGKGDFSGLLTVRSPSPGILIEKLTTVGEFAEMGKKMMKISDMSVLWAWANLKEGDLLAIQRIKEPISAEVNLPGEKTFRGTVDLVLKTMDEETRTVRARISLPNRSGELRPGMFVGIRLIVPGEEKTMAIPKTAVLTDEGRSFVFTHKEKDYWIRRPVQTGREIGGLIEVIDGLDMNQTLLTDGAFIAKSDVLRGKMGAGCAD